eukprot:TRINITY_DN12697_c0_g1_i1.p1 TRINITY_DN12697_c0_g1~~TRINITY_DN12697_c0_g1_i1.p1  ORF type:complete len:1048 (+),score=122.69 TRINITY_DN12697_c0_g1_i1:79-3222(+)
MARASANVAQAAAGAAASAEQKRCTLPQGQNGSLSTRRRGRKEKLCDRGRDASREGKEMATAVSDSFGGHHVAAMFQHMFERKQNLVDLRRRALTLIDVVAECQPSLNPHRLFATFCFAFVFGLFVACVFGGEGSPGWYEERSYDNAGGPWSEVHWGNAAIITSAYLLLVVAGVSFMRGRAPVQARVFECMLAYNVMQVISNAFLSYNLWREACRLYYPYPWGNAPETSTTGYRMGMLLCLQYYSRQFELCDTIFIVLRKRFHQMTFLHVFLRLVHVWGWFYVCRFACGGDSYFPAAVNSTCQVLVYLYYALSLTFPNGVPFMRKARVTEVQVLQFVVCATHASYVLVHGNLPRSVAALSLFVMLSGLVLYVEWDDGQPQIRVQATPISMSMFGHLFEGKPHLVDLRRRALTLIDVVMERENNGPLRPHRVLVAFVVSLVYWWFILPACRDWGTARWYREGRNPRAGGPWAEVHGVVAAVITVVYVFLVGAGCRVMERRKPVQKRVFEFMFIYNATQVMLNASLAFSLWREAWQLGYKYPWGNALDSSAKYDRLGMLLWFQYHCRQFELLDTVFIILRKKFHRMTFLQVWFRLVHMWGWFFACRYACGGDSYFPAAVNSTCQVFVYSYYVLSLLHAQGVPFMRRARVIEVQVAQFVICGIHACYVLVQGNLPRSVAAVSLATMCVSLLLHVDFANEQLKLRTQADSDGDETRLMFRFDSSGWFFVYHFGVATWLQEHILPEGMDTEAASTDKFPKGCAFSGSSGGSLVAASLGAGIDMRPLFEFVLTTHSWCKTKPWNLFRAVECAMDKFLPKNVHKSMSGRVRALVTRASLKPPFITGEVLDQFDSFEDAYRKLRASCHVPGLNIVPYRVNDRYYFDGLFWSSLLVPWSGDTNLTVKISATGAPLTDIRAPTSPLWFSFLPPNLDALRGLYWIGYRDTHAWFTKDPADALFCCRPSGRRIAIEELEDPESKNNVLKHDRAQKLLLRRPQPGPAGDGLPELDPVTGQVVADLIAHYRRSVDLSFRVLGAVSMVFCIVGAALVWKAVL